jgi:hypothetical protein
LRRPTERAEIEADRQEGIAALERAVKPPRAVASSRNALTQHYLSCPPLPPVWLRTDAPLLVGRGRDCDVPISGSWVSRHHASFTGTEEGVVVSDMDSANGILVNGERVHEARLECGDVVEIGGWRFTYRTRLGSRPLVVDEGVLGSLADFDTVAR